MFAFFTPQGLASLRMELSDEPTLGLWKISALIDGNTQVQTFTVDEYGTVDFLLLPQIVVLYLIQRKCHFYKLQISGTCSESLIFIAVLPKYEVTIDMPNYVLINTDEVEGTICAR